MPHPTWYSSDEMLAIVCHSGVDLHSPSTNHPSRLHFGLPEIAKGVATVPGEQGAKILFGFGSTLIAASVNAVMTGGTFPFIFLLFFLNFSGLNC